MRSEPRSGTRSRPRAASTTAWCACGAAWRSSFGPLPVNVIENAAVRAVGRSGTLELGTEVWKFLNKSARDAAAQLQPDEKLLYQPSFREPMLAKVPFPPFALSENDAAPPHAGDPTGDPAGASPAIRASHTGGCRASSATATTCGTSRPR